MNNVLEAPGVAAGLKGKTLLQMTIGTAEGIRAQQTWAKEHGCKFVVGLPVSYPRTVGQPNCLLVFAGDPAFNDHTTLLGSLGECQYVGEDPVEVLRTSYALGPMIIGTLALFFETAAAARQSGLSMSRYYSLTRPHPGRDYGWHAGGRLSCRDWQLCRRPGLNRCDDRGHARLLQSHGDLGGFPRRSRDRSSSCSKWHVLAAMATRTLRCWWTLLTQVSESARCAT